MFRDRDHFNEVVEQERNGCRICGTLADLCIDHNHATGHVRGILCQTCNRAIGLLGDSAERLRRAAEYLEQADGHPCPTHRACSH